MSRLFEDETKVGLSCVKAIDKTQESIVISRPVRTTQSLFDTFHMICT